MLRGGPKARGEIRVPIRLGPAIDGAVRAAMQAVYPPICPVTREETAGPGLSAAAWAGLSLLGSPACSLCGRELPGAAPGDFLHCDTCLAMPRHWQRGAAAFRYDGTGRDIVLAMKRADRLHLVPMIAGWMLRAGRDLVAEADLVAPVPLHWRRRLGRRFNQSAELARALCRQAGKPGAFAPMLLSRTRATASQGHQSRAERIANMAGAFAISPAAPIAGKRVLLIDDVLTTGATLNACAECCQLAGAKGVDVLVSALVDRDLTPYLGDRNSPSPEEHPNDED